MPVLRDYKGSIFTRLDLVQHVADTDGGAHVDSGLVPDYADVKDGIALGWAVVQGDSKTYVRDLELHCLRQIAHEFLSTAREYTEWAFKEPYSYPKLPQNLPEGATLGEFMAVTRGGTFLGPSGIAVTADA